jgi:hypothetical protein
MQVTVEDIPNKPSNVSAEPASVPNEVSHLSLKSRFNIDLPTKHEDKQLAEVWKYARNIAKSEDMQDIIWEVIHLESVLGAPRLGETRLNKLYTYIKLKRQEQQIQEELKNVASDGSLRK